MHITEILITNLIYFLARHSLPFTVLQLVRHAPCFSEALYDTFYFLCAAAMLSKKSPVPTLVVECGIGEGECPCSPCWIG